MAKLLFSELARQVHQYLSLGVLQNETEHQ
jgi:hypothetical protein